MLNRRDLALLLSLILISIAGIFYAGSHFFKYDPDACKTPDFPRLRLARSQIATAQPNVKFDFYECGADDGENNNSFITANTDSAIDCDVLTKKFGDVFYTKARQPTGDDFGRVMKPGPYVDSKGYRIYFSCDNYPAGGDAQVPSGGEFILTELLLSDL